MARHYTDHFGYLGFGREITFSRGKVAPVAGYSDLAKSLGDVGTSDGVIYPPVLEARSRVSGTEVVRARSQHNQPIQRLAVSHELVLYRGGSVVDKLRRGRAGVVVQLLGLLYGFRCHFHDWWIDGPAFVRSDIDHVPPPPADAGLCLDRALDTWKDWGAWTRRSMLNALYLHGRTRASPTEWERFQAEYQVFDAIFAVSKSTRWFRKRLRHSARFGAICRRYRVAFNDSQVRRFVRLRNDLVHEGIWDRRAMGDLASVGALHATRSLHKLTKRLALAVLGVRGEYVRSAWWGGAGAKWKVS